MMWWVVINIFTCLNGIIKYLYSCSEWWPYMLRHITRILQMICNWWQMLQHTTCLCYLVCLLFFLVILFCSDVKIYGTWFKQKSICMTGPVDESKNQLPDILCVIQVCIFGIDNTFLILHFCLGLANKCH
jgi:hypothetical protein